MSLFESRSYSAPAVTTNDLNPARLGTDEIRRAELAFAIGELQPTTDPPSGRRVTRANLPDVDWSQLVPVREPTRLQRLARFLGLARRVELAADEWRVLRPMSDGTRSVRHEDNIISINRAA